MAYITGRKEFWTFALEVNNSVLIPRPDTEIIVEEALEVSSAVSDSDPPSYFGYRHGQWHNALALASEIADVKVVATDISDAALTSCEKKRGIFGAKNKIDFRQGNLFDPVERRL